MKKAFFITGTDTEVGKTYSTTALLRYLMQQGLKTAALKPIASDATMTATGLRNNDALQLQDAMSMEFPYDQVNPFTFEPPIAPHIAAKPNRLDVDNTIAACQPILQSDYEILLIEGAGGWLTPLNEQQTFADLAAAFACPIILVVGLRLGCLNHSLLTWENIKARQLPFAGWIANHIDPTMLEQANNITTLTTMIGEPPLGIIRHQSPTIESDAGLEYTLDIQLC